MTQLKNWKHILLFLVSTAAIGYAYYNFIFKKSQDILENKIEQQFMSDMTTKTILFDNVIAGHLQAAKSISSRSMIRIAIDEYNNNKKTFEELKQYTTSKYNDGIKALNHVTMAHRYVKGEILANTFNNSPRDLKEIIGDTTQNQLMALFSNNDSLQSTFVISPIKHENKTIGFDILCFDNSHILNEISDPNIKINISKLPESYTTPILTEHNPSKATYHIKSEHGSFLFNFTIEKQKLYTELKQFYNNQITVTLLLLTSILLLGYLIYKRNRLIILNKSQYLRDRVQSATNELSKRLTELNTLNKNLQERENRLRLMFENNGVPTLLINPETQLIEDANTAAIQFYGYTIGDLKKMKISDINQLSEQEIKDEMRLAKAMKKAYFNFPHRLANGEIREVEVHSSPITIDEAPKLYSIILDITERKKATYEIEQLNEKLSAANEELNANIEELNATNEELQQINQTIEKERKQFLSILDNIPEIIYVAEIETHEILFANEKLKSTIGRDVTGEKCYKAIQNQNEPCDFCTNKHIKQTNKPFFWDHYNSILQKHYYVMDRKIQWTNHKEVRFELATDITQQKQFELALRKSEEKYRLITENASDVIWILNITQNKFTYISPSVFALRGYTQEEAMSQAIEESLTPESIEKISQSISEKVPQFIKNPEEYSQKIFIDELRQPCKDGSIIWIETSTRYQFNENKEIEVIGISRNIEERKKHQVYMANRLRYEENLALFSNVLFHDEPDVINKGLKYILEAAQCSRVYIFENFYDKENQLAFKQTHEICAENVKPEIDNEQLQHLTYEKDGFERWQQELSNDNIINGIVADFPLTERIILESQDIKSVLSIPIWVHGQWYGFIGFDDTTTEKTYTDEDINLLRTASEILGLYIENQQNKQTIEQRNMALSEANATKDKFFSIVSHDLRSPFSSILGLSELLTSQIDQYDKEKIKHMVSAINNAGKNTYKLLETLLEWSRAQAGRIQFAPYEERLQYIVNDSIEQLTETADSKQITIIQNIDQNIIVNADINMLRTIIRNLISNSIKFTKPEGEITLLATQTPNECIIEIKDTGIGMSQETIDKLFKIEEKVSRTGTNNESGSGLGLLLCKEFVEKHGGHIWVESMEGQGSRFTFTIPHNTHSGEMNTMNSTKAT